jgi:hypothetical protein
VGERTNSATGFSLTVEVPVIISPVDHIALKRRKPRLEGRLHDQDDGLRFERRPFDLVLAVERRPGANSSALRAADRAAAEVGCARHARRVLSRSFHLRSSPRADGSRAAAATATTTTAAASPHRTGGTGASSSTRRSCAGSRPARSGRPRRPAHPVPRLNRRRPVLRLRHLRLPMRSSSVQAPRRTTASTSGSRSAAAT